MHTSSITPDSHAGTVRKVFTETDEKMRIWPSSILRSGDRLTTTAIATHHGFWRLGRFARYYQQLFGCTPSETRRRA